MTDEFQRPAENLISQPGQISALASANAPILHFDEAPFHGHIESTGAVTLTAHRQINHGYPDFVCDKAIVAHLRGSIGAFRRLRASIDSLIRAEEEAERLQAAAAAANAPSPEDPTALLGSPERPFVAPFNGRLIRFIAAPAGRLEYPNVVLADLRAVFGCTESPFEGFEVADDQVVMLGVFETIPHMAALSLVGAAEKRGLAPFEAWRGYIATARRFLVATGDGLSEDELAGRIGQASDGSISRMIQTSAKRH